MTSDNIKFTINFSDLTLDDEERDEEVENLLYQLHDLDEVEANRIVDLHPPAGNKSLGALLVGVLTAEVNVANCNNLDLYSFFAQRRTGCLPVTANPDGKMDRDNGDK